MNCTEFLQWSLPKLRFRWKGFRKVRSQVCKRLNARLSELKLGDFTAYQNYLQSHPDEWKILYSCCFITISRFYRDKMVFDTLKREVLPYLAHKARRNGDSEIRCWSAGCCSGEEPYTLKILWNECMTATVDAQLPFHILATDANIHMLERARTGRYQKSSFRELPEELQKKAFVKVKGWYHIREIYKTDIEFLQQDIRDEMPAGPFHLILCRNLVLTYFDEDLQRNIMEKIVEKLMPGGIFVVGSHEKPPPGIDNLVPYDHHPLIYVKTS